MNELERALNDGPALDAGAATRAQDAFAERAQAEGLVDVAYTTVESPIGDLLLATTERGLVRLSWIEPGLELDSLLGQLAGKISPRVLESPVRLDGVRRQLDEYFGGARKEFDLAVDFTLSHGFYRRALRSLERVPFGELTTYRAVATSAGNERAVRAAGNAVGSNPTPIVVPCHRVVRTGGALGGYGGGRDRKRFLLELEGSLAA